MPSHWSTVPLSTLVAEFVDNRGRTAPVSENGMGIPLIATNCIKEDNLYPAYEKLRYVSQETYDTWFRAHPEPGDIIIVNKGTPGLVCMVPDPVDFTIAQDMVAMRIDRDLVDVEYLFAYLRSRNFKHQVSALNVGTTIPHLKKTNFPELLIPIPPRHEQGAIGNFYLRASEKIDLLHNQNRTLESIAQALFKHWFVDFEFPNHEGKPYKSSDGKMVESKLGEIPEGWEVGCLADLVQNFDSKRIPLSSRERQSRQGPYPYYGATSVMDYVDDYIFDGVHVLLGEDGSVVDERGRPILQYVWGKIWVNNHAHVLQGRNSFSTEQLLLLLGRTNVTGIVTGAVQPKINQRSLNSVEVVVAPAAINKAFGQIVEPVFAKQRINTDTSATVTRLRDTLLPKLMSGEVRIGDIPT